MLTADARDALEEVTKEKYLVHECLHFILCDSITTFVKLFQRNKKINKKRTR